MASTELPWLFLGRRVRPFALAAALATLYVSASLLIHRQDAGNALDDWTAPAIFVGGLAALSSLSLIIGWWRSSERLMKFGLISAAGVFGARAGFIFADTDDIFALSAWLSTAWAVALFSVVMSEKIVPAVASEIDCASVNALARSV